MRRRDQLHLFERFHPALRLARLGGLRLEAVDVALQMLDRALLLLIGALLKRDLLRAQDFELRIVAAIALDLLLLQMQRDVADRIEKFAVVGNYDQRARIAVQPVFEPDDCVEVKVIGRFVEQQQVRAAHQRLREIEPHAPAAGEAGHRQTRLFEREAETEQQRLRARGRRVAVGVGEGGVGFAFGGAIMRSRSRGDTRFDGAQGGIAVERIGERGLVDGGRFLRYVGDLPGRGHREIAAVRVQFAEQHGKQGRLARAIRPDQPGFLAGVQGEGGLFEERLGAARETELVKADHKRGRLGKNAILDWVGPRVV